MSNLYRSQFDTNAFGAEVAAVLLVLRIVPVLMHSEASDGNAIRLVDNA
jgi:hypothetical protein